MRRETRTAEEPAAARLVAPMAEGSLGPDQPESRTNWQAPPALQVALKMVSSVHTDPAAVSWQAETSRPADPSVGEAEARFRSLAVLASQTTRIQTPRVVWEPAAPHTAAGPRAWFRQELRTLPWVTTLAGESVAAEQMLKEPPPARG
jgi:hypothetical protein